MHDCSLHRPKWLVSLSCRQWKTISWDVYETVSGARCIVGDDELTARNIAAHSHTRQKHTIILLPRPAFMRLYSPLKLIGLLLRVGYRVAQNWTCTMDNHWIALKTASTATVRVKFECEIRAKRLWVHIKYSVRDIICDVISHGA